MAEATTNDGAAAGAGADPGPAAGGGGGAGGGGDAGAAAPAWYADLPEDIRDNASLTRYPSKEDAARGLIAAQSRMGVPPDQLIRLPKADDAKAMGEVWNKLGRPEKADGYGDIKLPEGSPMDKAALDGFLAHMHAVGMTLAQGQAAVGWYGEFGKQVVKQATDELASAQKAAETALRSEWGAAYDANTAAAAAAATRFGGPELKAFADESGMGDDPRFLMAWKKVADALAEPGAAPHERGRDSGVRSLTPAEAKAERVKLEAEPAFLDNNHPHHQANHARRLELIRLEHPQQETQR